MQLEINKRMLILCEDAKSSQYYFNSFKQDEELKRKLAAVSIEVYKPENHSPLGLVMEAKRRKQKAKKEGNPFDEIWVIPDRDGHAKIPEAYDMALANRIEFCISVVCFEYWVLLHFEKTTKSFDNCDDIINYIESKHYKEYSKNKNCFMDLKKLIPDAIKNGFWLHQQIKTDIDNGKKGYQINPYTDIHKLVDKLYYPEKYLSTKK